MALCVVVVWQRDARHRQAAIAAMDVIRAPLANYLADHGELPTVYPNYPGANQPAGFHEFTYMDPSVIKWANQDAGMAVVGYGRVQSMIGPNGHAVILYDGKSLKSVWKSKKELGEMLAHQRQSSAGDP